MSCWRKLKCLSKKKSDFTTSHKQVIKLLKEAKSLEKAKKFEDAIKTLQIALELVHHMMKNETIGTSTKDILQKKAISIIIEGNNLTEIYNLYKL